MTPDTTPRASVSALQPCSAGTAANIGLPRTDVVLILAKDPEGNPVTLVSEPGYAQLMREASQSGRFTLDAGRHTPIPLWREGWPVNWRKPNDPRAWMPWCPEAGLANEQEN